MTTTTPVPPSGLDRHGNPEWKRHGSGEEDQVPVVIADPTGATMFHGVSSETWLTASAAEILGWHLISAARTARTLAKREARDAAEAPEGQA